MLNSYIFLQLEDLGINKKLSRSNRQYVVIKEIYLQHTGK